MKRFIIALLLVAGLAVVAHAGEVRSVKATVVHGSGAIQAVLNPGEFTVPAGKTATHTKCFRADPSSGWSSDALCKVYSVTAGHDMVDGGGNPVLTLPPGTYRFAVGGKPGAYGTYTYELQP